MGPVSFTRLDCGSRSEALALARRLTEAGVRVELVADDTALLVRDEHTSLARRIREDAPVGSDDVDAGEGTRSS